MKIVYIAHPISGNVKDNLARIASIVKMINLTFDDIVPFVPYYSDLMALDDSIPAQRERGIQNNKVLLPLAHELWVFGNWLDSKGVKQEIELAKSLNIPVKFKTF